ncbi:MAG: sigma factor [Methylacidiphilaceae bacterium]|nr:sigma factor [Candidatus Methylacidiphilaceae bacterium]
MNAEERLAERFEASRGRLRALAYRMLGSLGEAEDAVQTSWLRLVRAAETPQNLEGWLTRTTARLIVRMEVICDPKHLRKLSLAMLPSHS